VRLTDQSRHVGPMQRRLCARHRLVDAWVLQSTTQAMHLLALYPPPRTIHAEPCMG
jgi:hypothetical protein